MRPALRNERGLTLVELTVVMVIASMVMMGMIGFYLSSQATWMEGSGQAITQREGTFMLERITAGVRPGHSAVVATGLGSTSVTVYDGSTVPIAIAKYEFSSADSLLHEWTPSSPGGPLVDRGGLGASTVVQFSVAASPSLVTIPALRLRSSSGEYVEFSTSIGLYNK